MPATRLTSFTIHGRTSFGAVTDAGMVDLGGRLGGRYASLLALIRGGEAGLKDARAACAFPFADYKLSEIEFLRPVLFPEKIVCVGINYPERANEYKDGREKPKYPNLFVRFPDSLVGHEQALVRPKVSEKFDYEGEIVLVIGRQGRNVPRENALSMVYGLTLGNEGTLRDWLRHGTLNVTQGKNFDRSGSLGPWIVPADEVDPGQAAASDDAGEWRAAPGRQHGAPDLGFLLADRLHHAIRDAEARRSDFHRHAGRRRRPSDAAQLAEARRCGGSGSAGDRRVAEHRDRRDVNSKTLSGRTSKGG